MVFYNAKLKTLPRTSLYFNLFDVFVIFYFRLEMLETRAWEQRKLLHEYCICTRILNKLANSCWTFRTFWTTSNWKISYFNTWWFNSQIPTRIFWIYLIIFNVLNSKWLTNNFENDKYCTGRLLCCLIFALLLLVGVKTF